MLKIRDIVETTTSIETIEGAGVHLRRAFGFHNPERTDPFLLFDDFRSDIVDHYRKGFPWHPHRGIDTITYVLKGEVEHGDSLGNKGVISMGDVQWMTAGSGIIHQEMPKGDASGSMHGFQLWLNLPAAKKMCSPRYRDIASETIPTVQLENGVIINIISGVVGETTGPVSNISTEPQYLDISLPAGTRYRHSCPRGHTALAYVIEGSALFSPGSAAQCGNTTLVLFGDGDEVEIISVGNRVRFLLLVGKPLGEPIAWHGPIVMNTEAELRLAFDEYRGGTFLKHGNR